MNKETISNPLRRSYDNTLRQAQAEGTRQRILDAAVEAIAKGGAQGGPQAVTLAEVARTAGVSEPTLYRHFGSRDRLYDELEAHAQATLGLPPIPERMEDFPGQARRVFERFGEASDLVRAITRTGLGAEVRAHGRASRTRRMRELLAEHAPGVDEGVLDRTAAVLRVLVSFESFEKLTGELGLSSHDAGAAIEWATDVLLAGIPPVNAGRANHSTRRQG